jgi:hypothetical protein
VTDNPPVIQARIAQSIPICYFGTTIAYGPMSWER